MVRRYFSYIKPQILGLYFFDFSITSPDMAAKKEASKMLNFEAVITSGLSKAKLAMKMLMVKPIPPKSEMPKI